jgi:hypothetical protein
VTPSHVEQRAVPAAVASPSTGRDGSVPPGGDERPTALSRLLARLRAAAPALVGYAAVRAFGLLVLALYAQHADRSLPALLGANDGQWYLGIAANGYDTSITYDQDGLVNTNVAFFPLFPALIRLVSVLGVPPLAAGVAIAALCGLAAAWGIYAVGAHLHSRQLGVLLAVLWGALPHAIVQNMVYAESVFTALCAWALWCVLTRRWVLAGVLTAAAGLTRPTAVALIATVGLACAVAVARRDGWRPWLGALVAPVGVLGYWAWCAAALNRPDGWFWMQREGWKSQTDFGSSAVRQLAQIATKEHRLAYYLTTLVLVLAVALVVLVAFDRRWPWPVLVFGVLLLVVTLISGGNYYHAKARFLIPAFTLLIPVAIGLVNTSRLTRYVVLATLTGLSAWYGSYLLLVWNRSP